MLICLANSYKNSNRCIAGIDLESGEWLRPFSSRNDGAIPLNDPLILPQRINLLDLVKIPLNPEDKRGYEIENQGYYPAPWQIYGHVNVIALLQHRENELLYSQFHQYIPFDYLQEQIRIGGKIRTLQLIEAKSFHCYRNSSGKYRGKIKDKIYGIEDCELSITDPFFQDKLTQNEPVSPHCLLCMSLGQPWQPEPGIESRCYRLIAGVIELLPEIEQIQTAMERAGWNQSQGCQYLQEQFSKFSRYELTAPEAQTFLKTLEEQALS